MSHLEPERLVLLALGEETLDQHETGHLDTCAQCRSEMDELRDVAGLGRQTQRLRDLPPPPEHVWQRIRAELASSERALPPPAVSLHSDGPDTRSRPAARPVNGAPWSAHKKGRKRGPSWVGALAIAVVAAATAVGVTLLAARDDRPGETVALCRAADARVQLQALPGTPQGINGYACLRTVGGERKLILHAEGMPAQADGDYEAWLLDRTSLDGPSLRMQALGVMGTRPDQELTVPGTLDLSKFDVIDISAEPHDGNAAHSGHSLLRGTLP